ncbi:hypothetical protein QOZ95_002802 [Paenibacillus brasilensis]|uniref:Uncharacterized protein n=1 Tax=Paenibacillus brasilensis TaxID=128574 RepID=A0ABU0L216_9BACL|nr:hypothetical protein [Paenibacillus brasilensis]MDQ0494636.1 hypothetical protein [Paenibacillus brasilensis]
MEYLLAGNRRQALNQIVHLLDEGVFDTSTNIFFEFHNMNWVDCGMKAKSPLDKSIFVRLLLNLLFPACIPAGSVMEIRDSAWWRLV